MSSEEEIVEREVARSFAPFGEADRRMILAMSKAIVAIGQRTNESKWSGDLAVEQFNYRQRFFPETIKP